MPGIEAVLQLSSAQDFSLDVNLALPGRGITAIFGASGSGKTTLLRCVAGLQHANGRLTVNDTVWQDANRFVPTHQRALGYVFQESSLFAHLSAEGNLAYAVKRASRPVAPDFYAHVVALMGLAPVLKQYPAQLSGGERQRVAIARALLIQPRLLLMDEPLASLDLARKREILPYLERLHEELEMPVLYVSHMLDEVARLADYLVVLDRGRVMAQGALSSVLSQVDLPLPLGEDSGVVVEATVAERDEPWHLLRASFSGGDLWVRDSGDAIGKPIRIRILARDVSLARESHQDTSIQNRLPVKVLQVADDVDEAMALLRLQAGDDVLIARLTRRSVAQMQLQAGAQLWAQIKAAAIVR